jgi:hypothetical protein
MWKSPGEVVLHPRFGFNVGTLVAARGVSLKQYFLNHIRARATSVTFLPAMGRGLAYASFPELLAAVVTVALFVCLAPRGYGLDAPTNLRLSPYESSFDPYHTPNRVYMPILWDYPDSNYCVFRAWTSTNGIDGWEEQNRQDNPGNHAIDTTFVTVGQKGWFAITAMSNGVESAMSAPVSFVGLVPPSAGTPSYFFIDCHATNSLKVIWQNETVALDGSSACEGFYIDRSTDAVFSANVVTFTNVGWTWDGDQGLVTNIDSGPFALNQAYYYRVRAYCSAGVSEVNNRPSYLQIRPNSTPDAVTYFDLYLNSAGSVISQWDRNVYVNTHVNGYYFPQSTETGYRLDRSTDSNAWTTIKTYDRSVVDTLYTDTGLTPGQAYWYRVVATNILGDSPPLVKFIQFPSTPVGTWTNWYVSQGTVGNASGTNLANAWPSMGSINWSVIKPGDNIYIGAGTYNETLHIGASGATGSNILIKSTGTINQNGGINFQSSHYVTIDGSIVELTPSLPDGIGNNIQWTVGNTGKETPGVQITSPIGLRILWLNITNCGDFTNLNFAGSGFNLSSDGDCDCEIAYVWTHYNWGYGFNLGNSSTNWGTLRVHHCITEYNHGQGLGGCGALDLHDSIVQHISLQPGTAHGDAIHTMFINARIWNNRIYDIMGTMVYNENTVGGDYPLAGLYVYNNVIYQTTDPSEVGYGGGAGCIQETPDYGHYVNDVRIFNNTIYNMQMGISFGNPRAGWTLYSNCWVYNNIVVAPTNGNVGSPAISFGQGPLQTALSGFPGTNYWTNTFLDYNIASLPCPWLSWNDVIYTNAADMAARTVFRNNKTASPTFIDPLNHDFRLGATDTAARGAAMNLMAWTNNMPGLDKDISGAARPVSGAWDIGAYQYDPAGGGASITVQPQNQTVTTGQSVTFSIAAGGYAPLTYQWLKNGTNIVGATSGSYTINNVQPGDAGVFNVMVANSMGSVTSSAAALVVNASSPPDPSLMLWFTFEDNFYSGTNYTHDRSGHNTDGLRWGRPGSQTNYPTLTMGPDGSQAAEFHLYYDGYGEYGDSGDYIGITNIAPLQDLTNATIAVWAKFYTNAYDNATLFSSGGGSVGDWMLGRFYSDIVIFSLAHSIGDSSPETVWAPVSYTNTWNHYVVTWDGNGHLATMYLDGLPVMTNTAPTVTSLHIEENPFPGRISYLGMACWTFGEDPWMDLSLDGHPNNGWMDGAMDDARIYSRALSASEVQSLYSGMLAGTGPLITLQPKSQTVTVGQTVSFAVGASGSSLTYQWKVNGNNINGATSSTLTIINAQSINSGNYSVVVGNGAGTATSLVATLTVNASIGIAPSITTQPQSQSIAAGQTVSLTVGAAGDSPLTYQWMKNANSISGATSTSYIISNAQAADAGIYSVVVANGAGNASSLAAILTVNIQSGSDPSLKLYLSFNGGFSNAIIADASGNNNNAVRFSATNWPGPTSGVFGSQAALFSTNWVTDVSSYGSFAGITNWNGIASLNAGTWSAWVLYQGTKGAYPWSTILDAGSSRGPNGWSWGCMDSASTLFAVWDSASVSHVAILFPDDLFAKPQTSFHHYAVTWDGSTFIGYFDGAAFQTNTLAGITSLSIQSPYHWLALGCKHFGQPPQMGDGGSLSGWMGGAIDEVRIYNRALSIAEIGNLYSHNSPTQLGPPIGLRVIALH